MQTEDVTTTPSEDNVTQETYFEFEETDGSRSAPIVEGNGIAGSFLSEFLFD